ncbi:hypothetical protein ACQHIV_15870 [Kribbella sp. GL6]|uniref:hypothetical protein n=1 Tax=Kribbella sp. GL6 TaxID=3419765 RepID=UPI003D094D01
MVDSSLAFTITARDLGASAVFDKVARSADKTSGSLSKTVKISAEAQKASEALTKAQDKQSDVLGRVAVAEKRLQEVRANSNSKASQIVAAENNLAKARRDAARAGTDAEKAAKSLGSTLETEGKQAGKSLGKSVLQWFTGDGGNVFKQAGENAGNGFIGGAAGVLKTPVLGPALAVGLGAAVVAVLPEVGAMAASGLVAGFGAGIGALGLKFAAESEVVKRTWSTTLHDMGAEMRTLSQPFESTLISLAATAKKTFATFAPELGLAFKTLDPAFTQFGNDVGRAFERLAPAMQPLSSATAAVLRSLGGALPDIVGKLSSRLIDLSNSVEKNPQGLKDLAEGIGGLADSAIKTITVLNDLNGMLKKLPGGFSTFTGLAEKLNPVKAGFDALFTAISKVDGLLGGSAVDSQKLAGVLNQSGAAAVAYARAHGAAAPAITGVANATVLANRQARALTAQFTRQTAATNALITALFRLQGVNLGLSNDQIAVAQATADATASLKANGKGLDLNTAAGRANQSALNTLASATNTLTADMIKNGKGTDAAGLAAERSRANFVKIAHQMGLTIPQAEAMAKSMIGIPNVSRTARLNANIQDLQAKLSTAKTQLADKNLTATKRAKLEAEIKQLQQGIAAAKAALASVPSSKTVTITTNFYRNMVETHTVGGIPAGIKAPGRASGGPVKAGQPYLIGEKGPEILITEHNGFVVPNRGFRQLRGELSRGFSSAGKAGTGADIAQETALVQTMIGNLTGGDKKLSNALAAGSKKLIALANLRVQAAGQLKAAQDKLTAAVQVRNDFKKSITDAALSFNSIVNTQADSSGSITASAIIGQMSDTLRKTQNFVTNLASLKAKGLNSTVYQQLAEAGAGQGGDLAAALLGGGQSAINAVNSLQGQINKVSGTLGTSTSGTLYQAGVDAAQGLVNGLLAKTKALDAASAKLVAQIVARIKKDLGIHSPSKVLAWHGSMATEGFASGMVSSLPSVAGAASQLANMALPTTGVRQGVPAGPRPGGDTYITINVTGALDARDAGDKIIKVLRREIRIRGGNSVQKVLGT